MEISFQKQIIIDKTHFNEVRFIMLWIFISLYLYRFLSLLEYKTRQSAITITRIEPANNKVSTELS